ncbi:MAG: thiamine ABC transporter substrate-binding protein, partial [Bdellovibrionota bacterium]
FLGIPEYCKQCAAAEELVNLMLSEEGQKILMEKNYMFPVIKKVMAQTPFERVLKIDHLQPFQIPASQTVEENLNQWAQIRRQN